LAELTVRPMFLPSAPLMNPRTLWACQGGLHNLGERGPVLTLE
jgi:hypothetical protein